MVDKAENFEINESNNSASTGSGFSQIQSEAYIGMSSGQKQTGRAAGGDDLSFTPLFPEETNGTVADWVKDVENDGSRGEAKAVREHITTETQKQYFKDAVKAADAMTVKIAKDNLLDNFELVDKNGDDSLSLDEIGQVLADRNKPESVRASLLKALEQWEVSSKANNFTNWDEFTPDLSKKDLKAWK